MTYLSQAKIYFFGSSYSFSSNTINFTSMEAVVGPKSRLKNEKIKIIYERRAVRKFIDKPVERKLIEQVIFAGTMAPSAINKQPWKFYVITNKPNIRNWIKINFNL